MKHVVKDAQKDLLERVIQNIYHNLLHDVMKESFEFWPKDHKKYYAQFRKKEMSLEVYYVRCDTRCYYGPVYHPTEGEV